MIKFWSDEAWEDFEYWLSQDRRTLKKILKLIKDIERNGYNCIGKPEPLKHEFSGYWSVEIDEKNRLVFRLKDNSLEIIQCGSHYNDKR